MKSLTTFFLTILICGACFAQQNLSVEFGDVDVELVTTTQKQTKEIIGTKEFPGAVEIVKTESAKTKAKQITFGGVVKSVQVFNPDFESFPVRDIGENKWVVNAKPGRYLLVAETDSGTKIQPFAIEGKPDPKPEDPKPPIGGFADIEKLSLESSVRLNDQATRQALATALGLVVNNWNYQTDNLSEAVKAVNKAVESTLLARRGSSLDAHWLNGWRRPVDKLMAEKSINTADQYKAAIQAVQRGLAGQASLSCPDGNCLLK